MSKVYRSRPRKLGSVERDLSVSQAADALEIHSHQFRSVSWIMNEHPDGSRLYGRKMSFGLGESASFFDLSPDVREEVLQSVWVLFQRVRSFLECLEMPYEIGDIVFNSFCFERCDQYEMREEDDLWGSVNVQAPHTDPFPMLHMGVYGKDVSLRYVAADIDAREHGLPFAVWGGLNQGTFSFGESHHLDVTHLGEDAVHWSTIPEKGQSRGYLQFHLRKSNA